MLSAEPTKGNRDETAQEDFWDLDVSTRPCSNSARLLFAFTAISLGICESSGAEDFALVIAHGRAMDPETGLDAIRYIAIADGKIAAISETPLKGRETIDATGLVSRPALLIYINMRGMRRVCVSRLSMELRVCSN